LGDSGSVWGIAGVFGGQRYSGQSSALVTVRTWIRITVTVGPDVSMSTSHVS